MPYLNIPDSPLTSGINFLVSKTVAEVQVRISTEVNSIEQMLKECPGRNKIGTVAGRVSGLRSTVGGFTERISRLGKITQPLGNVVRSLELLITVLQTIPIPGTLTTVGLNVKYANILQTLKELKKQTADNLSIVNSLIYSSVGALPLLQKIQSNLEIIDNRIQNCVKEVSSEQVGVTAEGGGIPTEISNNMLFENTTTHVGPDGTTYTVEVIVVDSSAVAPLRQAVAIDRFKIIRYKSDISFSSSSDVLVREVKFRIDNNIIT
jgi:hypothetical protein